MKKSMWVLGLITVCCVGYGINAPAHEREEEWQACFGSYFSKDPQANRFEAAFNRLSAEQSIHYMSQLKAAEQHRVEFAEAYCGKRPK